jgi:hypothetical protein
LKIWNILIGHLRMSTAEISCSQFTRLKPGPYEIHLLNYLFQTFLRGMLWHASILGNLNKNEVEVALMPIFILISGALATWFARERRQRVVWAISSGAALLAWLTSLVLILSIPSITSVSVWQEQGAISSTLELHLDRVGWTFLYTSATVVLAVSFTLPARIKEIAPGSRSAILVYAALPMISMMAGNFLTVAVTWAFMDVLTLLIILNVIDRSTAIPSTLTRIAVDAGGLLLVISAALININVGGSVSLTQPLKSPLSAVLLALAALLRLGLLPLHFSLSPLPQVQQGLGTLLRFFPPVAALSVLARLMNIGVPEQSLPWLRFVGALGMIIGGLRWALSRAKVDSRPFLVLAVSGLGVFASSLSDTGSGEVIMGAGVLLLITGSIASLTEIFTPTHRVWPILAGLMLAGLPGSPAGVIGSTLLARGFSPSTAIQVLFGILGLTLLSIGALRYAFLPTTSWLTGESLVRVIYGLGLGLPLLVGIGIGIWMSGSISFQGFLVFVIVIALALSANYGIQRLPRRDVARWGSVVKWIDPSPIYRVLGFGGRVGLRVVQLVGEILEGEGAMLWMFVILLLLYLGLRSTVS